VTDPTFPVTPIYDQLLRELEQPCPPDTEDDTGPEQPPEPAWPSPPPS